MFNGAGPLWKGDLWDTKLVNKMYSAILRDNNKKTIKNKNKIIIINENNNEFLKFLKIIKEESKIDVVGFYDLHQIVKKRKLKTMMKKEDLIKKIRKGGFKAENTHFSGIGIRSNVSYNRLVSLLKE